MTSTPANASGNAATPPAAPMPTFTTSVPFNLVAMVRLVLESVVVCGFADKLELICFERLLVLRRDRGAHARITEQIPTDKILVPAVVRIAEHALPGMVQHHAE